MLQQGNTSRLYSGIQGFVPSSTPNSTPNSATASSAAYPHHSNAYRRITAAGSIFGSPFGDDPFLQQARAAAALAEMDAKQMSAASMAFSGYHTTASMADFDPIGLASATSNSSHSMAAMIDPSHMVNQATADSMAASLQQHMMAMQHHYGQPSHFVHSYPAMTPTFSGIPPAACGASSFAAAAVIASGSLPIQPGSTNGLAGGLASVSRYPSLSVHGAVIPDVDTDPRELEKFAEHFKQRRIKLGVTQADVGKALAHLKMPGVGSLSQSTICRFESLTLSHNNMVALKPILHSWLERAEDASKKKDGSGVEHGILPNTEKKRKRTSIAAPEKRLLEEFFRQQPRPTGDRISAIADKLDLKKNVVRVWFCNQRQKQKRSQFRSRNQNGSNGNGQQSTSTSHHDQSEGRKRGGDGETPSDENNDENTPSPGSEIDVKCPVVQPAPPSQLSSLQPSQMSAINFPIDTTGLTSLGQSQMGVLKPSGGGSGVGDMTSSGNSVGNLFYNLAPQQ